MIQLGGNIELTGFRDLDRSVMVIVKKIVGNYAKKFSERLSDFEKLSLTVKKIHETEKSEKYEIKGMLVYGGKMINRDTTDFNLFVVLDSVLKNIENSIE